MVEDEDEDDDEHEELEEEEEYESAVSELLSRVVWPIRSQTQQDLHLLGSGPDGPEFGAQAMSFRVEMPVARADIAGESLAVLNKQWRLAVGLALLPDAVLPPQYLQSALADADEVGLIIVSAHLGSLEFLSRPLQSAEKVLKTRAAVAFATLFGLAQGPLVVQEYAGTEWFGPTGAKVEHAAPACQPITAPTFIELERVLGQLPQPVSITGTALADNGARLVGQIQPAPR